MNTKKRILLIDDVSGIRKAASYILRQAGYDVTEAEDGAVGIHQLHQQGFDLVITDLVMPNKDGNEVLDEVMKIERRPCIIAMSGGGATQTADQALRRARRYADCVMMKPYGKKELLETVKNVLHDDNAAQLAS